MKRIGVILFVFSISFFACKKPLATQNAPLVDTTLRYTVYCGKYFGTYTNYGYGDSITKSYSKSNCIITSVKNTLTGVVNIYANGSQLYYTAERSGRYQPFGTKPGVFNFTIIGKDTLFRYYYNGRPDNVIMQEFEGKKLN